MHAALVNFLMHYTRPLTRPVDWIDLRDIMLIIKMDIIRTKDITSVYSNAGLIRLPKVQHGQLELYHLEIILRATCTRLLCLDARVAY